MKIAVVHSNADMINFISLTLGNKLDFNFCQAGDASRAIDLFSIYEKVDLLICEEAAHMDSLFFFLKSQDYKAPIIFVRDASQPYQGKSQDLQPAGVVEVKELEGQLVELVSKFAPSGENRVEEDSYIRAHVDMLLRMPPLKADIFLKLSQRKFVKLFKNGVPLTQDDYNKYVVQKGVSYFYVRKSEIGKFLASSTEQLESIILKDTTTEEEAVDGLTEVNEVTFEIANRLGFTPAVQDLVKKNVVLNLKAMAKNIKLQKLLARNSFKGKNHLSTHSVLLAIVSCCIASEMNWTADQTFNKLILAAILHDIALADPELSKMRTLADFDAHGEKFTSKDKKLFLSHSYLAAELAKSMKEIPSDVDVIIAQHHELPNGKGFPKGLSAMQIAPLATIMIVAHDVVDHYYENPSSGINNLSEFFKSKKDYYTSGMFKKIAMKFL